MRLGCPPSRPRLGGKRVFHVSGCAAARRRLPYALPGLVYRELTWDPGISLDELKKRVHRGFFSAEAPVRCTDDLIWLRQFSISHWQPLVAYGKTRLGYGGELAPTFSMTRLG